MLEPAGEHWFRTLPKGMYVGLCDGKRHGLDGNKGEERGRRRVEGSNWIYLSGPIWYAWASWRGWIWNIIKNYVCLEICEWGGEEMWVRMQHQRLRGRFKTQLAVDRPEPPVLTGCYSEQWQPAGTASSSQVTGGWVLKLSLTINKEKREKERMELCVFIGTNLLHLSQLRRALILNAIKMYLGLNALRCFLYACKDVFGLAKT